MHRGVALGVDAIVVRVNQVALNVVEGLHLDAAHLFGGARAKRRIVGAIDKLADSEDGNGAEVLGEHEGGEGDGQLAHAGPLERIAHRADHNHHGDGEEEELTEGLNAEEALEGHDVEAHLGNVETNAKTVVDEVKSGKRLRLHRERKDRAQCDVLAALAGRADILVLPHVEHEDEETPERLRDYENPAGLASRARGELGTRRPDNVEQVLEVAEDDSNPEECVASCALHDSLIKWLESASE